MLPTLASPVWHDRAAAAIVAHIRAGDSPEAAAAAVSIPALQGLDPDRLLSFTLQEIRGVSFDHGHGGMRAIHAASDELDDMIDAAELAVALTLERLC